MKDKSNKSVEPLLCTALNKQTQLLMSWKWTLPWKTINAQNIEGNMIFQELLCNMKKGTAYGDGIWQGMLSYVRELTKKSLLKYYLCKNPRNSLWFAKYMYDSKAF